MPQSHIYQNNILIVDDTPDNLTVLAQILTQQGYLVRPAINGPLALKAIQRNYPDLILLDIMMPGMDGYEVCRQLKANEQTRNIPVVFISALNETIDKVKAFRIGGVDYITKPFQAEEVLARVQTHLNLQDMQKQLQEQNIQLRKEIGERERAENQLRAAHDELKKTLEHLTRTQAQLVQSEKLAALGRVVAGIAHEIKNPLNFINNFAQLITDMIQDLSEELELSKAHLVPESVQNIEEVIDDIIQTAAKINHHGQRADKIIQDMLEHSRGGKGKKQLTSLNMLLDEYVHLAYHEMRARDSTFGLNIETEYDPAIKLVNLVPQSLSRVFLNIVNNACYAVKAKQCAIDCDFTPTVWIRTKEAERYIEIRIRDNGNGIAPEIRDQIFNPFFTTKPPGKGTGLGLSISYDIVVQEHQGGISVETEEGQFTEFIIILPKQDKE